MKSTAYTIPIKRCPSQLNWSFASDRCLLDWTRADFEDYAAFILCPTSALVAPSKQTRFLGSAASAQKPEAPSPMRCLNGCSRPSLISPQARMSTVSCRCTYRSRGIQSSLVAGAGELIKPRTRRPVHARWTRHMVGTPSQDRQPSPIAVGVWPGV